MATALAPLPSEARVTLLDALRGFALCIILLTNIRTFSGLDYTLLAYPNAESWLGAASREIQFATWLLLAGKVGYVIFPLLFGLGFSIQLLRGQGRPGWLATYLRRLSILLLIGAAHAVLLWHGDVLSVYAVMGFLLLPFRKLSPRAVLAWAVVFLLAPIGVTAAGYLLAPGFDTDRLIPDAMPLTTAMQLMASGSYREILAVNWEELLFLEKSRFFTGMFFTMLGFFMVGLYAGKRGLLQEPERYTGLWKRLLWTGLALGLAFVPLQLMYPSHTPLLDERGVIVAAVFVFARSPLTLAYLSALILLWLRPRGRSALGALAPMGRMALTNYILQTVFCVLIYYGYGLGWYGRMPTLVSYLVVVPGILGFQVIGSGWWLRRFRYGPVEWVWRQATYRRRLPLRIEAAAGATSQP